MAKITPTNEFDGDSTQYQLVDALKKLPNNLNDYERVLTLNEAGDTWSVNMDLTILPNKYFFLARPTDDFVVGETYSFKGTTSETYSFTSEVFTTGNLLLIIIDTGAVRCYTISKSLQNVLDTNPIASFTATSSGSILQIEEVINSFSDFYSQKTITSADNNTQAVESLGEFQSTRQANTSNATYQTLNQDTVGVIVETEGSMNTIRAFSKEIISSGHTGSVTIQAPTPKTGEGGVNVIINLPYREKTGDYSLATIDLEDNYANDGAAAASGRIPVGGLYHNAGVVKVRLT